METKQKPVVLNVKYFSEVPNNFTGIVVCRGDGSKQWFENGIRHREDGPAVEYKNGRKTWWLIGCEYTESGWKKEVAKLNAKTAEEAKVVETKEEPVVLKVESLSELPNKFTGIVEVSCVARCWYKNGLKHREDGPAVEWASGAKSWWLNGFLCSEEEWKAEVAKLNAKPAEETKVVETKEEPVVLKVNSTSDIPEDFSGCLLFKNGKKEWCLDGMYYSEAGWKLVMAKRKAKPTEGDKTSEPMTVKEFPTLMLEVDSELEIPNGFIGFVLPPNGDRFWYETIKYNDKGERVLLTIKVECLDELPDNFTGIVELSDFVRRWHKKGRLHREDGPAIERADGSKSWWLNGFLCSEEEWKAEVAKLNNKPAEEAKAMENKEEPVVLKLNYRQEVPSNFTGIILHRNGEKVYSKNGKPHREDGPAIIWNDGVYEAWYSNGLFHRVDGPARKWANGTEEFWLNDMFYSEPEWKAEVAKLNNKPAEEAKPMKELDPRFGEFIHSNDGGLNTRLLSVPSAEAFRAEFNTAKASSGEGWHETGYEEFTFYKNGMASVCPKMKVHYICYTESDNTFSINTLTEGPDDERFVVDGTPSDFFVKLDKKTGQLSYNMGYTDDNGVVRRILADTQQGEIRVWENLNRGQPVSWMKDGVWVGPSETVPTVFPIQQAEASTSPAVEPSMNSGMIRRAATTIRGDLPVVGLRVAAGQVTKAIQSIVVKLLAKSTTTAASNKSFTNQLNTFFSSPSGKVVLGFLSSLLLPQLNRMIPEKYHPVLSALSDEMRIQAETTVACSVVDELTETLHFISQTMIESIDVFGGVNAETVVNSGPRVLVESTNNQPTVENTDEAVVFQSTGTETNKA
jgi:hypothetical protein